MPTQQKIVTESVPTRTLLASFREVWLFRASVRAFAERDVRVKYKQAALGVAWALVQPLAYVAIFTFTIGRLSEVETSTGVPYAAFTLSATVPWTFLSTSVGSGSSAILANSGMIRRVYFPREVPVLAAVASALVDFAIGLVLVMIVGPIIGAEVSPWWLLTPVLVAAISVLAVVASNPLAALNVYYRDFRFALAFVIQLWLFASPVAYPLAVVPEQWQEAYAAINPAAGILNAFSDVLAAGVAPDWMLLGISLLSTLLLGLVGYRIFMRLEPGFADVI